MTTTHLYQGHALEVVPRLPAASVQTCITSPPYYGLRAYAGPSLVWDTDPACAHVWGREARSPQRLRNGMGASSLCEASRPAMLHPSQGAICAQCGAWCGQLGLEPTVATYLAHLVQIFREVKRVLRPDGVLLVNIADSYAHDDKGGGATGGTHIKALHGAPGGNGRGKQQTGLASKNLCLIPQRLTIALQDDGWIIRQVFPWVKRNAMPQSVQDRPVSALEWWIMAVQQPRYFSDMEAVRQPHRSAEDARNRPDYVPRRRRNHGGRPGGFAVATGVFSWPAGGRTYRNTDLWFASLTAPHGLVGAGEELVGLDVLTQAYSGEHYATFNTNLVTPLLQMATSPHGCCPQCGAAWQRVVARACAPHPAQPQGHLPPAGQRQHGTRGNRLGNVGQYTDDASQVGWRPTCAHADVATRPCVVLDPFAGRGTTLLAAQRLGLDGIGIELNPADVTASAQRLKDEAPLLAHVVLHGAA